MTGALDLLALAGVEKGTPTGAAFDLVLLAHVAVALVAFAAVAVSGFQALRWRAQPSGTEVPASLARYYAPGVNWPGRALHLVPVLGLVLIPMSRRAYGFDDGWIQLGLVLWTVAALGAEGLLWPAERRIQQAVAGGSTVRSAGAALQAVLAAAAVETLLLVATVIMVAKP